MRSTVCEVGLGTAIGGIHHKNLTLAAYATCEGDFCTIRRPLRPDVIVLVVSEISLAGTIGIHPYDLVVRTIPDRVEDDVTVLTEEGSVAIV